MTPLHPDFNDPLKLARSLRGYSFFGNPEVVKIKAAEHIERLVAENAANERNLEQLTDDLSASVKLLRQAVQELEWAGNRGALVAAIRQYLKGRA